MEKYLYAYIIRNQQYLAPVLGHVVHVGYTCTVMYMHIDIDGHFSLPTYFL